MKLFKTKKYKKEIYEAEKLEKLKILKEKDLIKDMTKIELLEHELKNKNLKYTEKDETFVFYYLYDEIQKLKKG